jgi:hypothetical protein
MLVQDLIRKTSAPYEILLWLNTADPAFEDFLRRTADAGRPVRTVGRTPGNIGMRAYRELFQAARQPLIVQVDDDVIRVSPGIAEAAARIFGKFPAVRQLVADVWQDEFTTGARPPLSEYRCLDEAEGLYDGPIDGWFSIYHRSILPLLLSLPYDEYCFIGAAARHRLRRQGLKGLLCTGMKVFHAIGPQYASLFGLLDFEVEKYRRLKRPEIVAWYEEARGALPHPEVLAERFSSAARCVDSWGPK